MSISKTPPRYLIIARHGKTFASHEPSVWLGCHQDIPLSSEGEAQARCLGQNLQQHAIFPLFAVCSPMRRARQTLQIALGPKANIQLSTDKALSELDYGQWTGKTSQEIEAQGHGDAMRAWQDHAQWPQAASFSPSRLQVIAELTTAAAIWHDLLTCPTQRFPTPPEPRVGLVVGHSGRLRLLPEIIEPSSRFKAGTGKLSCGNVALLVPTRTGWACRDYNVSPSSVDWSTVTNMS